MEKPKIVIIINGGLVTGVYANTKADVVIIDHDSLRRSSDVLGEVKPRTPDYISDEFELNNVISQEIAQYQDEEDPE